MQQLNLPRPYAFEVQCIDGKEAIFDPLRRKYVRLTPEEWVRQNFVQYLIRERGFPRALTALEQVLDYYGSKLRADIVVYNRQGKALLMVECKAPEVKIEREVFEQIGRYNLIAQVRYLIVTNGLVHYCCTLERRERRCRFLEEIPRYEDL